MLTLTTLSYLAVRKEVVILKIIDIKKIYVYSSFSQSVPLYVKDFFTTLRFQEVQNAYKNCSCFPIVMQCKASQD